MKQFKAVQQYILLKPISLLKSLMSVLLNSTAQFSKFCSKNYKTESLIQLVYAMKEMD